MIPYPTTADGTAYTITTRYGNMSAQNVDGEGHFPMTGVICTAEPAILRMERTDEEKKRRSVEGDSGAKFSAAKQFRPRPDDISNTLTSNTKDNMLIEPLNDDQGCSRTIRAQYPKNGAANLLRQDGFGATGVVEGVEEPKIIGYSRDSKGNVISRHLKDTANTLCASNADAHRDTTAQYIYEPPKQMAQYRIRKLTPRECFRLMDVDDADIDKIQAAGISNNQQYKLAGNSIVVAPLFYIFKNLFGNEIPDNQQLSLF